MDKLNLILINLSATNRRKSDFMCFLTCVTSFLIKSFNTVSFLWCQIVQFFFQSTHWHHTELGSIGITGQTVFINGILGLRAVFKFICWELGNSFLIFYTSTYTFFILTHFYTKFCVLLSPCKQMGGASVFVRDVHSLWDHREPRLKKPVKTEYFK